MATLEDVLECPKCGEAGEMDISYKPIARSRDKMRTIWCRNPRCKWYDTAWAAQQRPDGTYPDPDTRPREKGFPPLPEGIVVAKTLEGLDDLLTAERRGDGELRGR